MNYEDMTQLALRGVVRDSIRRVIREDGLPGAHHFYITFLTRYPEAIVDQTLAEKYPEEITIVLEHQFWELSAPDEYFEVTLKFGGVPKYLKVPYLAITRFHDPSVGFSLHFDRPAAMEAKPAPVSDIAPAPKLKSLTKSSSNKLKKKPEKKSKPVDTDSAKTAQKTPNEVKKSGDDDNVVSLDNFRKK